MCEREEERERERERERNNDRDKDRQIVKNQCNTYYIHINREKIMQKSPRSADVENKNVFFVKLV